MAHAAHHDEHFPIPAAVGLPLLLLAIVAVLFYAGYQGYLMTRPIPLFHY